MPNCSRSTIYFIQQTLKPPQAKTQAPQPQKFQSQPQLQQQQQAKTTSLAKPEVATVIAAYEATGSEQLSLQVGQIVSVRKKNDSGWWEGELQVIFFDLQYIRFLYHDQIFHVAIEKYDVINCCADNPRVFNLL